MTKKYRAERRRVLSGLGGFFACAVLGQVGAPQSVSAVEELYAPAPPAGSAFVRFMNASAGPVPLTLAGRSVGTLGAYDVSAYFVAAAGPKSATAGKARLELPVAAGNYYTLVVQTLAAQAGKGEGLTILTDTANPHLAKAQVSLYNLSSLPTVALKTANGAATLVDGVGPQAQGQRAVNAITVDLAVFSDGRVLQAFPGVSLAQGAAYSAVVFPGTQGPLIRWTPNRTDTTR